jgi:hypothetical protein
MEDILLGVRIQDSVEEKEREFSHLTAHCPLKRFAPIAQILLCDLCAMLSLFTWFSH